MFFSRILMVCLASYGLTVDESSLAANLANGKALYIATPNNAPFAFNCADVGCHKLTVDNNFPNLEAKKNSAGIKSAIAAGSGGMGVFYGPVPGVLTNANIDDIAAYIANPGSGAVLAASTTALTFPAAAFGANPAPSQTVNVVNTGLASLSITSANLSGTNAAEFALTNNCATAVAATTNGTGKCTINVTMKTDVVGNKGATLTIVSNGGTQPITITGSIAGAASVSSNAPPTGLAFPDTAIGSTTAATIGAVTLTNSGAASLSFTALTVSTDFSLDQSAATSCKTSTPVAIGRTCTLNVRFAPGSVGSKTGTLSIAHSGTASPATINLSGKGIATSTPTPAATLTPSSALSFGNQTVGTASTTQTTTLTNGGSKVLTIANIQDSNGTEFVRTGTCANGQIAIGADCTIVVAFSPASAGAKSGTITVTDDAGDVAGSTQVINLSGTGTAVLLPAPTLAPATLDYASQSLNTSSAAQVVTITNTSSTDALNVTAITLGGTNASEFTIDSSVANACSTTTPVAVSGSCVISVTFMPTASGARDGTIDITTNATGSPHSIGLTGSGSVTSGPPSVAGAATNVGAGGCTMQSGEVFDPVLLALFLLGVLGASVARRDSRFRNKAYPHVSDPMCSNNLK